MPRDDAGRWTPPTCYASWGAWRADFGDLVSAECRASADSLSGLCEALGESSTVIADRWRNGYGRESPLLPPNWPAALSAGEWRSLSLFAENEYGRKAAGAR